MFQVCLLLVAAVACAEDKPQVQVKDKKVEKREYSTHTNSPVATSSVSVSFGDGSSISQYNSHQGDAHTGAVNTFNSGAAINTYKSGTTNTDADVGTFSTDAANTGALNTYSSGSAVSTYSNTFGGETNNQHINHEVPNTQHFGNTFEHSDSQTDNGNTQTYNNGYGQSEVHVSMGHTPSFSSNFGQSEVGNSQSYGNTLGQPAAQGNVDNTQSVRNNFGQVQSAVQANFGRGHLGSYAQLYGGVHSNAGTQTSNKQMNNIQNTQNNQKFSPIIRHPQPNTHPMHQAEVMEVYLDAKPGMFNYNDQHKALEHYEEVKGFGSSDSKPADFGFGHSDNTKMEWTQMHKDPSHYVGADVPISAPIKHDNVEFAFENKVVHKPTYKAPEKEKIESITIHKEVKYPVAKPYPVAVIKHIAVPVFRPVPYHVDKPYPVYISKPFRVPVYKHVPYTVVKHVPYTVHIPYKVPVFQHYPVHITKPVPYPVPFTVKVPVPHHYAVHKPVPILVKRQEIHRITIHDH